MTDESKVFTARCTACGKTWSSLDWADPFTQKSQHYARRECVPIEVPHATP